MDSLTLVAELRRLGLWPDDEATRRVMPVLQQRFPDGKALARELIGRDLLTPYQANQALAGKGQGLLVGPYLILERLGEGGMGHVFKARRREGGPPVALKVIRAEHLTNAVAVERFCREMRAATQLHHPNIIRAYDADQVGDTYYYTMQYTEGKDLSRLVRDEGALAVERARDYTLQTALGLQYIHRNGLIHRDIKPSNLLVTRPAPAEAGGPAAAGPWGQVKILDLGTARLCQESAELSQPALTKLGTVMGTADYMAPEQAISSSKADARSDIYGLGCTLYYMLAAEPPYPGGNAVEKMLKHQLDRAPPIEKRRPDVPPAMARVLERMMAKKPDERYQSADELVAALSGLAEAARAAPAVAPAVSPAAPVAVALPAEGPAGAAPVAVLAPPYPATLAAPADGPPPTFRPEFDFDAMNPEPEPPRPGLAARRRIDWITLAYLSAGAIALALTAGVLLRFVLWR
jgi:serine/threonine-protein kinase